MQDVSGSFAAVSRMGKVGQKSSCLTGERLFPLVFWS